MVYFHILKNDTYDTEEKLPQNKSPRSTGYDVNASSEPEIVGKIANPDRKDGEPIRYHSIDYIQYRTSLWLATYSKFGGDIDTLIMPRSSISKYNLSLANSIGLVDADYRGEFLVRFNYVWQPEDLSFDGKNIVGIPNVDKIYKKGDAVCQLKFTQVIRGQLHLVDKLDETQRGAGGFGSTDAKTQINNIAGMLKQLENASSVEPKVSYEQLIKNVNK